MAMIVRVSKHEYKVAVKKINKPYDEEDDDLREIIKWCKENFGVGGRNKKCIWRYGWIRNYNNTNNTFYFKFEKDALFFCMRWL